jgi:putative flippase GtrA
MATTTPHLSLRDRLRNTSRILVKEIAAFGAVGIAALVIDLGIFKWLADGGALKAKCISTVVSTTFAYFGNRYFSFSHRARQTLGRETGFFFGINLLTLVFSELIIAVFVYPFHQAHGGTVVFVVNIATIGLGTIFRFWAYKRFVFLHPDKVHAPDVDLDEELAE